MVEFSRRPPQRQRGGAQIGVKATAWLRKSVWNRLSPSPGSRAGVIAGVWHGDQRGCRMLTRAVLLGMAPITRTMGVGGQSHACGPSVVVALFSWVALWQVAHP
jgi:hypothetical protein